jgi:hypothetical protein
MATKEETSYRKEDNKPTFSDSEALTFGKIKSAYWAKTGRLKFSLQLNPDIKNSTDDQWTEYNEFPVNKADRLIIDDFMDRVNKRISEGGF